VVNNILEKSITSQLPSRSDNAHVNLAISEHNSLLRMCDIGHTIIS
jgi:hypothetical protein